MKILKFSGIVLGVHLLALVMIFANPGCSSSTKAKPAAADTVTAAEPPPTISVPSTSSSSDPTAASTTPPPITFNSDINAGVRYSPTRPGTPAAAGLQAEPVSNVTPATTYTVVKGDSLWTIAHKNHLTIAELAAANNLTDKAKLQLGQKLIIPAKGPPAAAASTKTASTTGAAANANTSAATKTGNEPLSHTVRPGETLSAIAKRYGVKQGEVAVANNITDPQKIRAGMILIIPGGWESANGKAARTEKAAPATDPMPTATGSNTSSPASGGYEMPKTPPPAQEVPVIQVEEAPAPKTP
jgi:LysM repeat protein